MNVLFVHFGDDWLAGSEIALLELMRGLRKKDVHPFLWCNTDAMQAAAQSAGITVGRDDFAHAFDYSSPRFSLSGYVALVRRGTRLIARSEATIVHCNSAAPAQWMLPACRIRKVPMLVNLHSPYHRRSRYVLGLHLADRIVAVSSAIAAPLLADGMEANRVSIVYNGFDATSLLSGNAIGLREQLDIPSRAAVGAIAGSLIRRKGHDLLFQAMRRRADGARPFHLLVIGDGPERAAYEREASGLPVHFLGYRNDIGAILRDAADFLVVPSRQEAFGRVIIEAAFAGIPAIGARVDGIPEAIQDEETGLLVASESPAALADAIARLVEDEVLRHRLGRSAQLRAQKEFSIDKCSDQMLQEYRATIRRHRRSALGLGRLKPYWKLAGSIRGERCV